MYVYMYVLCMYICMYICLYVCMHARVCTYVCVCMYYVCMYVCVYVCICIYVCTYFIYVNKSLSNPNCTHPSHITSQLSLNTNCSDFKRRINKRYEPQDLEDLNMCSVTELCAFVLEIIPTSVSIPFINCYNQIINVCYKNEKIYYSLQKNKFL